MLHHFAIFSCLSLCCISLSFGQQQIFEIPVENSKAFTSHHIQDRSLNQSYLLRVGYDEVDVFVLDDSMQVKFNKTFKIGLKEEKYYLTELLGFTAENGIIHGYYTNYNITIPGYLVFNMRAKRVRRGQLPFDMDKKDEYLFHFIKEDVFYMVTAPKKSSTLKVYKILAPKNIRRTRYRIEEYRDLHEMFKTFSEPKPMDVGVIVAKEATDLSIATKKIKAYIQGNTLDITFESNLGTELISLQMDTTIYKEQVLPYRKFKNKGFTNNSNSYILGNYQFVARSSGKEILFYVKSIHGDTVLFENRFTPEMEEIPLINELPSGKKIYTSSSFYRNTPRDFLRVIDNGNVGVVAQDMDDYFLVSLGNFKEENRPLTNPYESKLTGKATGESSYIQTKLSKTFEWVEGKVEGSSEDDLARFFDEKEIKARYVYAFEHAGNNYVSFLDRKKKTYHLFTY